MRMRLAAICVFLAFAATGLPYLSAADEPSEALMLIPPFLLVLTAGLVLLSRSHRPAAIRSLGRLDSLAIIWLIPVAAASLMLAVAYRESLDASRNRIPA